MIVNRIKPSVTKIAGIMLFPGNNKIEGDEEKKLREHKDFQTLIDNGLMKIVEVKPEKPKTEGPATDDDSTDDITEMSAKDAVAVVKETMKVDELEEMLENETRKSVLKVIKAQIKEIREGE